MLDIIQRREHFLASSLEIKRRVRQLEQAQTV